MITIKDFLNLVIQISTFPLPFAIRRLIFLAQGHSLSKKSYIAPFSFVLANKLVLEDGARISPLSIIKAQSIYLKQGSRFRYLSIGIAHTVKIGKNSQVDPFVLLNGSSLKGSEFIIGDHSRLMLFSYLDLFGSIHIGDHSHIGGRTMIFTHQAHMKSFFSGSNVTFGDVHIGNYVTVQWDCLLGCGITIGDFSHIGVKSFVSKNIAPNSTVVGSRIKVYKDTNNLHLDPLFQETRLPEFNKLLKSYLSYRNLPQDELLVVYQETDLSDSNTNVHTLILKEETLIINKKLVWLDQLEAFLDLCHINYKVVYQDD